MGAFWKWFLDFFYPLGSAEAEPEAVSFVS
jgi:hypothetical protein